MVVADNPFSVDKEYNDILHEHKASKSHFVIISDSESLRCKKDEKIIHKVFIPSTFQLNDLRQRLLNLEMKDGGIKIQSKQKPEKHPIWLYIIDKD